MLPGVSCASLVLVACRWLLVSSLAHVEVSDEVVQAADQQLIFSRHQAGFSKIAPGSLTGES